MTERVRRIAAHSPETLSIWEYYRQILWSSGVDLPEGEAFKRAMEDAILDSVELRPGEKAILSLSVPAAAHVIVFEPVTHAAQFLDVKGEPTRERRSVSVVIDNLHAPIGPAQLHPGPVRLLFENRTNMRVLPAAWITGTAMHRLMSRRKPFLTAKRLLSNQTFRDVYGTETLEVDQRLNITSLTFLFTDLKDSVALYELNLLEIPAVTIVDLDEAKLRSLRLALNRLGEDSSWDPAALSLEFSDILEMDGTIDLQITGFEMGEIDVSLDGAGIDEEDELPTEPSSPVTQVGDLWIAGEHRIFCGDALMPASYEAVLGADSAEMVFADPPYNVAIAGNVSGLGAAKHDEFAMASGEMSPVEFAKFLQDSFSNQWVPSSSPGASTTQSTETCGLTSESGKAAFSAISCDFFQLPFGLCGQDVVSRALSARLSPAAKIPFLALGLVW